MSDFFSLTILKIKKREILLCKSSIVNEIILAFAYVVALYR